MQLRDEASKAFETPSERLILIFGGKILKDEDTIEQLKIKDGFIIHLVISVGSRFVVILILAETTTGLFY